MKNRRATLALLLPVIVVSLLVSPARGEAQRKPKKGVPPALLAPPVTTPFCAVSTPALGGDGMLYTTLSDHCNPEMATIVGLGSFDPSQPTAPYRWGPVLPPGCDQHASGWLRFGLNGPSVGSNGLLYAVGDWNECGNGRLAVFRAADGSLVAQNTGCGPHPRHVPALDEDLRSVYFGTSSLCSVDMDGFSTRWAAAGGQYVGGLGIAIDRLGNVIYGTDDSGSIKNVRSISPAGTVLWSQTVTEQPLWRPHVMAVLLSDVLLIQQEGSSNSLLAWDAIDATELWRSPNLTRPVVDGAGNLYASGVVTPEVVSLRADGSERWRIDLAPLGATWAAVDFVDAGGVLYVRTNTSLVAIKTAKGSVAWEFPIVGGPRVGAVLDAAGHIVILDANSTMYVLDTALQYASSEWPIAEHGNRRHTGRTGQLP